MRKGLANTRRMAATALGRLMSVAVRQPQLKRAARLLLSRIPGLQSRLRSILYRNMWTNQSGAMPPEPMIGNEAPARTARIFHELKQAQQARKDRCE